MSRVYKCLPLSEYVDKQYKLIPIRDEDKYAIMEWRNEQIDILRQGELLTREQQEKYFATVVNKLFEEEKPKQLLFSFFESDRLIGYGGLVHIDWQSLHAEVSFITETKRNFQETRFIDDWKNYLKILKQLVQNHLGFVKIFTYAYDLRPALYRALEQSGFKKEACLKDHVIIKDQLYDVLIHSHILEGIGFTTAREEHTRLYFDWANDEQVRKNSFNQDKIIWDNHCEWFRNKIRSSGTVLLVAMQRGQPIGQIRFDSSSEDIFEVDFSVDPLKRGQGLGSGIIREGTRVLKLTRPLARRVIGRVKKYNLPSRKAFLSAGYVLSNTEDQEVDEFYLEIQ